MLRYFPPFHEGMIETATVPANPFRIVIFTSVPPRQVARIMTRIRRDAPEAQIVGVLYERRPPKTLQQRMAIWRKKSVRLAYWRYVIHRISATTARKLNDLLDATIRVIHAAPKNLNGNRNYSLDDLRETCRQSSTEILVTKDIHSPEALDFVRALNADLGLVFGTRILKPALFEIPKQGSINIHKRKVPDYRGGGAVGLWELLDNQKGIGITVHRVEAKVDVGAVVRSTVIPIEPFDELESLGLKADVVGADLIVAAIRDFATGTVRETPQTGPGKTYRNPPAEDFLQMKKKIARRIPKNSNPFRRPAWKLLVKSLIYAVPVALRNWKYRRNANYPVMILYHHLVSDRPHRYGNSTAYFLRLINYLYRHYRVVSLSEAVDLIRKGGVNVPTVAVTFDDGYADNFINLRAVTEETGLPVGYFIATQHISTGRQFAHDEMFHELGFRPHTWEEIAFLKHCGFEIGSHTRNHADCGSTDPKFLQDEIAGSDQDIQEKLGGTIHFSFPFGLPVNISEPAAQIACGTYANVFSAYGGGNFHADGRRILRRWNFPHTVWELELQLQAVLTGPKKEPSYLQATIDKK